MIKLKAYFHLLMLLIFASRGIAAQEKLTNPTIDSLKTVLQSVEGTQRVDLLNHIGYNYYYFNNDSTATYALKALELAEELEYQRGLSEAQRIMGISFKADNNEAKAIEWLSKGLETAESINDYQGMADNLNSLGIYYKFVDDIEEALNLFRKSVHYQRLAGNRLREGLIYNNIGMVHILKEELDSSEYFFKKSLHILDSIGDPRWQAMVYSQYSVLLLKQNRLKESKRYATDGMELSLATGQTFHLRKAYQVLAEIYLVRASFRKSKMMADRAERLSEEIGFYPYMIESYDIQHRLNLAREHYKEALNYHKKYALYRDSLRLEKSRIESSLFQYMEKLELTEEENLLLRERNEKQEAENEAHKTLIQRQTMFAIAIGILLLIVSGLAIVFFRLRQKEHEANQKMQQSNRELEDQKEELTATLQMVEHLNAQLQAQNNTLNKIAIVSITDLEGNIVSVNNNFCEVSGFDHEQLIGKRHNLLASGEHSEADYKSLWETITSGNTWRGEFKNRKANGDYFWVDTAIAPILNDEGNPKQFFSIQFEITERKDSLNELAEKSEELEELNNLKDKLLSVVSHDFRSPLNSLRGTLSLFLKGVISNDELITLTESLVEKLDNTHNLLENLLNWTKSQMQGTKVYRKDINLKSISEDCVELLSPIAEKKLVKINNKINPKLKANADNEMVKLVIRNLISNAIKFTSAGDQIDVAAEQKENYIVVSVRDSGIGISNENQDKLFRPENFTTNGTSNEAGMGLGLLLCKDFVEKNGGEIWFESEYEKGSCFHFSLPPAG